MSALPSPPPNASATRRGLVSKTAQEFAGPKTFVDDVTVNDTLNVGADWEHEEPVGDASVLLTGLPLQLGGYAGNLPELLETPGFRRYHYAGDPDTAFFFLGRLGGSVEEEEDIQALGFRFEESTGEAVFLGTSLYVSNLEASAVTVAGQPVQTYPPASETDAGIVSLTDQVLGAPGTVKTFASVIVNTLATLAAAVTSLVRAVGASLVLRSSLGASGGDVVTRLGSEVTASNTAKLVSIADDLAGTPVERAYFTKQLGWVVGSSQVQPGGVGFFPTTTLSNRFTAASANTPFTGAGSHASLGSAVVASRLGTTSTNANTDPNAWLTAFGNTLAGTPNDVSYVTGRGAYGMQGTMGSVVGDQEINAAKGRAVFPQGENQITITNDQVTKDSVILIQWEVGPYDGITGLHCGVEVKSNNGSFEMLLASETGTAPAALEDYPFRFVVFQ